MTEYTPDILGDDGVHGLLEMDRSRVKALTDDGIIDVVLRFRLTDEIYVWNVHRGGNGLVLLCARRGQADDQPYLSFALKTVMPGREFSGAAQRRFKAECETWVRNSHLDGVMPATEYFEIASRPFLQMPVVLGRLTSAVNLRQYLRLRRLQRHEVAMLAAFASQGLARIEQTGHPVIHGDLKPENYLMYHALPHVSDFGSSLLRGTSSPDFRPGTPGYLPPEAEQSGVIEDVSGDVWSFGRILQDMLNVSDPHDDASAEYQRTDEDLRAFAQECLAPNPANRPASFTEAHETLIQISNSFLRLPAVEWSDDLQIGMRLRQFTPFLQVILPNVGQAEAMRGFGHPAEALTLLPELRPDDAAFPGALYARARVLVDLGNFVEAKALLYLVLNRLDNSPGMFEELRDKAWNELGIVYRRLQRWQLAKNALRQASSYAKEWKHYRQAVINLAATHSDAGETDIARKILADLLRTAPHDWEVMRSFAIFEREEGNLDTASSLMKQASLAAPTNGEVHLLYGEILCESRDWQAAFLEVELAVRTGAPWSMVGSLLTLISRFAPETTASSAYRAMLAATNDDERRGFAQRADHWIAFLEQSQQPTIDTAGGGGLLSPTGSLWLPATEEAASAAGFTIEASPRQRWPDFATAIQWFDSVRLDIHGSLEPHSENLLAFAKLAVNSGRLDKAVEAAALLAGTLGLDSEGIPYALHARLVASIGLFEHGDLAQAWTQAMAAVAIAERLDKQLQGEPLDDVYVVALQASAGAPMESAVLDVRCRQVTLRESLWGPHDARTLRARHNRALLLGHVGRFSEAASEMEDVVNARRATLGYGDDATLNSTILLSRLVGRSGDWARAAWLAEQAYLEALEICDDDDPRPYVATIEWAECVAEKGDVAEGVAIGTVALELFNQSTSGTETDEQTRRLLEFSLRKLLTKRLLQLFERRVQQLSPG